MEIWGRPELDFERPDTAMASLEVALFEAKQLAASAADSFLLVTGQLEGSAASYPSAR